MNVGRSVRPMDVDILARIEPVHREVGARERAGRLAHVLIASRGYEAAVSDLWEAVTSPDRLPRWFLPISGELRVGGRYQLEGNAGGRTLACEPPHHFAVTWEFGGEISWLDV